MSFFIGVIGVLISLIGWFVFDSLFLLSLGTIFYIVETILDWKKLNAGAKTIDFIVFGIGCLIKEPFYIGGMVAINCYSAIMCLLGLPMYIKYLKLYLSFFRK